MSALATQVLRQADLIVQLFHRLYIYWMDLFAHYVPILRLVCTPHPVGAPTVHLCTISHLHLCTKAYSKDLSAADKALQEREFCKRVVLEAICVLINLFVLGSITA